MTERVLLLETYIAGLFAHDPEAVRRLRKGLTIRLERERNNEADPLAIAVMFKGRRVGYVPRSENLVLSRLLDAGTKLEGVLTDVTTHGIRTAVEIHIFMVVTEPAPAMAHVRVTRAPLRQELH